MPHLRPLYKTLRNYLLKIFINISIKILLETNIRDKHCKNIINIMNFRD